MGENFRCTLQRVHLVFVERAEITLLYGVIDTISHLSNELEKMPEFFEKSPLSGAGTHPDFQVTVCLQNVSTDVKFDD